MSIIKGFSVDLIKSKLKNIKNIGLFMVSDISNNSNIN